MEQPFRPLTPEVEMLLEANPQQQQRQGTVQNLINVYFDENM